MLETIIFSTKISPFVIYIRGIEELLINKSLKVISAEFGQSKRVDEGESADVFEIERPYMLMKESEI